MMFGQMTAGSWIYIGSQGIIQGTHETFVEAGRRHYGGDLGGRWILTAGLGGMGGAQPLAATMAGACLLAVECRPSRIRRRLENGYLDREAGSLDEALADHRGGLRPPRSGLGGAARQRRRDRSRARPARRHARPRHRPDRRPRPGQRLPARGLDAGTVGARTARAIPRRSRRRPRRRWPSMSRRSSASTSAASPASDYGNNIRQMALEHGLANAFAYPGFVPSLYPAAVLPRNRAVPLGRPVGQSRGHLPDRRQGQGADPRQSPAAQLARHGGAADSLPGASLAHLLDRPRRAASDRPGVQRHGGQRRARGAGGDRPRPSRCGIGGQPQPGDRGHEGRLRRRLRLGAAQTRS